MNIQLSVLIQQIQEVLIGNYNMDKEDKKEYKVKEKDVRKMISFSKERISQDLKNKENGEH